MRVPCRAPCLFYRLHASSVDFSSHPWKWLLGYMCALPGDIHVDHTNTVRESRERDPVLGFRQPCGRLLVMVVCVVCSPERRYVMSLSVSDHTGSTWLSCFNDEGLKLLNGITADQMNVLRPPATSQRCMRHKFACPANPNWAPKQNHAASLPV